MSHPFQHRASRALPAVALALLTGCEAKLTVDLTDSPVDSAENVVLGLTGVTLLSDSDATVSLPFDETRLVDLLDYRNGDTYRLVNGEGVNNARYVGIALNFADGSSYLRRSDGGVVGITTSTTLNFAAMDLSLGERDEEQLVLDLNLRFSLVDDTSASGTYRLYPALRVAQPDTSGTITGVVADTLVESDDCRQGRATTQGVAVYAFSGLNITPADYHGQSNLIDAASVELDADTGLYRYSLHFLPEGYYTLALTCQADSENPAASDGLAFEATSNAGVSAGGTTEANFL